MPSSNNVQTLEIRNFLLQKPKEMMASCPVLFFLVFVIIPMSASAENLNDNLQELNKNVRILMRSMGKFCYLWFTQGPLKKWTEHSQELHLLKIHSRGGSNYTLGLNGGLIFGAFIIPKSSYQDFSTEGSKKFLSSLELVF